MAWSFAHYGAVWDYWYRTSFADFGDRTVENSFAKRVGEMLGEEAHNEPWSDEMKQAFVTFCDTFYEFPEQLELQGTTATGQPIYANRMLGKSFATALRGGQERLVLRRLDPQLPDSRLSVALSATDYAQKQQDHEVLRAFMRIWLLRGFIPIAATENHRLTARPATYFLSRFSQGVQAPGRAATLADLASQCFKMVNGRFAFAWRGDTRSWADVLAAGGLHAKVISNSAAFLDRINVKKPWHVFHEERFRNHMYFRRNSKDNCLDTAVSISIIGHVQAYDGEEFKTNTTFPQLKLFPEDKRTRMTIRYRSMAGQMVHEQRYVDHVRLYLFMLSPGTRFFDTYLAQGLWGGSQFPECAVRGVPANDIFGYITFVRVHHGTGQEMNEGFDAIPIVHADHSNLRRTVLGAQGVFNGALQRFSRAWREDGSAAVQPLAAEYVSIGNSNVTNGRLARLPQEVVWQQVRNRGQRPQGRVPPQPPVQGNRRRQRGQPRNGGNSQPSPFHNRYAVLAELDD